MRNAAIETAAAVRRGELSPVAVAESTIMRIDALDVDLHAFCTRTDDLMLDQAHALERRIARGEDPGPLAGVPVAVKDLIATRGIRTTGGSVAYEHFVPDEDDIVVERIVAAGGMIPGKTNVSELGYAAIGHNPLFATTRNPWNTDLTPGGSSAGSAVAVATGMVPLALGSDGGGSVRTPASFCGIVGVKAAMGRVPLYPGCRAPELPGLWGWESIEHIGPMARTVRDAALLLSVMVGPDPRDRHSIPTGDVDWLVAAEAEGQDLSGVRVGVSEDWGYATVDQEVRAVVRDAARTLQGLGASVEKVDVPWGRETLELFRTIVAHDSGLRGVRDLITRYGDRISPHIRRLAEKDWSGLEFSDALAARQTLANQMWRVMEEFDLLLTPVAAVSPFAVDAMNPDAIDGDPAAAADWSPFTFITNLTGQPSASIPAGITAVGLPVGVHLIGRHLGDGPLLLAAAAFEAAAAVPGWSAVRSA